MKGKLIALAAGFLSIIGFSANAYAQEIPSGPPAQVCKATNNLEGFATDVNGNPVALTFNECVLIVVDFTKNGADFPVAYCNYLNQIGALEDAGFSSRAQCISTIAGRNPSISAAAGLLTGPNLAPKLTALLKFTSGTVKLE